MPGTHYKYPSSDISAMISQAIQFVQKAHEYPSPPPPPPSIDRTLWMSQLTDLWLVHALGAYPLTGKTVVRKCTF